MYWTTKTTATCAKAFSLSFSPFCHISCPLSCPLLPWKKEQNIPAVPVKKIRHLNIMNIFLTPPLQVGVCVSGPHVETTWLKTSVLWEGRGDSVTRVNFIHMSIHVYWIKRGATGIRFSESFNWMKPSPQSLPYWLLPPVEQTLYLHNGLFSWVFQRISRLCGFCFARANAM